MKRKKSQKDDLVLPGQLPLFPPRGEPPGKWPKCVLCGEPDASPKAHSALFEGVVHVRCAEEAEKLWREVGYENFVSAYQRNRGGV